MAKNLPAGEGDTGSIPDPIRYHTPGAAKSMHPILKLVLKSLGPNY